MINQNANIKMQNCGIRLRRIQKKRRAATPPFCTLHFDF
jgi:hypothetical protein